LDSSADRKKLKIHAGLSLPTRNPLCRDTAGAYQRRHENKPAGSCKPGKTNLLLPKLYRPQGVLAMFSLFTRANRAIVSSTPAATQGVLVQSSADGIAHQLLSGQKPAPDATTAQSVTPPALTLSVVQHLPRAPR
jgi:hypothetical protein